MVVKRITILAFALFLAAAASAKSESRALFEQFLDRSFPDNSDVRSKFSTRLITAPKEQAWAFGSKVQASKAGQVLMKSVKRGDDFLVQFINGSEGQFPDYSLGSYVVERNSKTGYILQAKIFLESDPSCYARLYPKGSGTGLDVVMYGAVVKKGLFVSGLIYQILSLPFAEIVAETASYFDWSRVFKIGGEGAAADLAAELRGGAAAPAQAQPATQASAQAGTQSAAPRIALASMPSPFGSSSGAAPQAANSSAAPSSRAQDLAAALQAASSAEDLALRLAALGLKASELPSPPEALGLSDDGDPLVPAAYRNFPRYSEGRGLPLQAVRASLYLSALASPNSAYALVGAQKRVLALPVCDEKGRAGLSFFSEGKEIDWKDMVGAKDEEVRVLCFDLGS